MSFSSSSSSTSAQDLLNALIELRNFVEQRQLNIAEVFGNSKKFRANMSDLHPELDREIQVISSLIDVGLLRNMQEADANGRVMVAGRIRSKLDNDWQLKSEVAKVYSSALLAFYNGEKM